MGLVKCPSCEQITAMAASHRALAVCEHCGRALPRRRHVVTIARQLRSAASAPPPTPSSEPPHRMPAESHTSHERVREALELDYLAGVLEQLSRRAEDCELLLAHVEAECSPAVDGDGDAARPLRVQADAAVLRSQLARVRHASCLVESYLQLRREQLSRRHDFDNDKTTTTMEVS